MKRLLRFCVAGTVGFVVDAGVLTALTALAGWNPYAGRVVSFLAAATTTWWINRHYTFESTRPPTRAEWAKYLGLMVVGALVNYGVYALCITFWDVARANLWLAVALGSIAGLGINFTTSRALILGAQGGAR